ncbi:hypothetical protein Kisp02_27690 [Kineosporia sp. NBRC 101731]|nr:hypothetical protein Kisp02_27690 [Kineosporia sp. NBRC 101731]
MPRPVPHRPPTCISLLLEDLQRIRLQEHSRVRRESYDGAYGICHKEILRQVVLIRTHYGRATDVRGTQVPDREIRTDGAPTIRSVINPRQASSEPWDKPAAGQSPPIVCP